MAERKENERKNRNRAMVKWCVLLGAIYAVGMGLLAARDNCPPNMKPYFDAAALLIQVVVVVAVIGIFFLKYPSRTSDLMVIVMMLGLGMKFAIDAMGRNELLANTESPINAKLVVCCLITVTVLMSGAILGLKFCRDLKIESTFKRGRIIVCAMLLIPSIFGLALVPLLPSMYENSFESLIQILGKICAQILVVLAWFGCVYVLIMNADSAIRSVSRKTEDVFEAELGEISREQEKR